MFSARLFLATVKEKVEVAGNEQKMREKSETTCNDNMKGKTEGKTLKLQLGMNNKQEK